MALVKNQDYFVIAHLGKNQRDLIRQWMQVNFITGPYIPELGELAGDCITAHDYKEWIKTQQWPNGYPNS